MPSGLGLFLLLMGSVAMAAVINPTWAERSGVFTARIYGWLPRRRWRPMMAVLAGLFLVVAVVLLAQSH